MSEKQVLPQIKMTALSIHSPELCYLEPEHYRNHFHNLYWSTSDHEKKTDKKSRRNRNLKRDRNRKGKSVGNIFLTDAPILLGNPSQFAVFAVVRSTIFSRWSSAYSLSNDLFDESESEENLLPMSHLTQMKLPKMVGVGLCTLYTLIADSISSHPSLCAHALKALFDTLQGHAPEELMQEPSNVMQSMFIMLMEVCHSPNPGPGLHTLTIGSHQSAAGASCLLALVVAYGQTEYILGAIASLLMSPQVLADQYICLPNNVVSLQRSIQTILLGSLSRSHWLSSGVPNHSLVISFIVNLPAELANAHGDLIMRSITSDGNYIYIYTSKGLLKVGSGYGGTIKEHIYLYKPDFFPNEKNAWLGYCKNYLFLKMGRKRCEIYQIDKETFDIRCSLRLDPPSQWNVSTIFSDGVNIGVIALTNQDALIVRLYNAENAVKMHGAPILPSSELLIRLSRRRTLVFGWAPFEEPEKRRLLEPLDSSSPSHGDADDYEHISCVVAGQEFSLLRTESGKVYYTGKASSLGYKISTNLSGRWSQLTEAHLARNESENSRKMKVLQISVGHEGTHAILVTDDGSALFVGTARRGEDGDMSKHRRQPKPSRPKKIAKAEGHFIVYAACNYGSTALVTSQGLLIMFGKDTHHCDSAGVMTALKSEHITQVALGKAHGIAVNSKGHAFTFGINNKGQCGRDSSHSRDGHGDSQKNGHSWKSDICMVCTSCNNCTGFSSDCQYSQLPDRNPGQVCGCGEGDSGCYICGVCRRCASSGRKCMDADAAQGGISHNLDDDTHKKKEKSDRSSPAAQLIRQSRDSSKSRSPTPVQYYQGDESAGGSDVEKEGSAKISSLPPAKIHIPGSQKVIQVACGLHHTVVLIETGDVYSFGSNQYGQLGAEDLMPHTYMVKLKVPKCIQIAAGSNHTAVLSNSGEVYSVGNYQKGTLGRQWEEETTEKGPLWYTSPGRVHRLGPSHACKAVWISASADQTFIHVNQALVKTDVLFTATVTANDNTIAILPNRPEHNFKCIMISKTDGNCYSYTGLEQADFVNSLACLDPLYDVFWCYHPKTKIMKCYNILAVDSLNLHRCHAIDPTVENPAKIYAAEMMRNRSIDISGTSKNPDLSKARDHDIVNRLDYPNENRRALSILHCDLAIPIVPGAFVTRFHAALNLLASLDVMTFAHDSKFLVIDSKKDSTFPSKIPNKDDFLAVNRFENHGGGWGYSGHSIEAIRFMADADIILGGLGLFGGRGDYTAKIKLFDIGNDGGDQEVDGELLSETEDIVFECPPRDKFAILFDNPVPTTANRWYVAWACISGPSSDCGSSGQVMVINDDVAFHFKTSKKSNNGTDVNAGQIPCLLYNTFSHDNVVAGRSNSIRDPVSLISRNFSRWITPGCFQSLITLLQWSWSAYKQCLVEVNLQSTLFQKNSTLKQLDKIVYISRATLRLIKSYVNEIYQQNGKKRQGMDIANLNESIHVIKSLLRLIMADATPSTGTIARKSRKGKIRKPLNSYIEYTSSILKECHMTIVACFHAFFPTPHLKWDHLCSLLSTVKDGVMESGHARELTATVAALCSASRLRDVLHYTLPVCQNQTQSYTSNHGIQEVNLPPLPVFHLPTVGEFDSMEVSPSSVRRAHTSKNKQKRPPVPLRNHSGESSSSRMCHSPAGIEYMENTSDWNLNNMIIRLLELVTSPVKRQMQNTDHTHAPDCPILPDYQLTKHCCKLLARMVAELAQSSTRSEDAESIATKSFIPTPSRFTRINQSRSWNTGNGSPDAICFTVNKNGVILVGAVLYGGTGNYNYELEVLQDVKGSDDANPAQCWFSLDSTQGSYSTEDVFNDVVHVKFEKSIPLKENVRYAIRLRNHGGRTANGDGGLSTIKGSDGTIFSFTTCSLSFNGTTQTRGQIPGLLYFSTPQRELYSESGCEPMESISVTMRSTAIKVATTIMDSCVDLLKHLRTDYTAEDLAKRNAVLQTAPCFTILIPFTLANLLLLNDAKSSVQILEKIQTLTTHVAALNLQIPSQENVQTSVVSTTSNHYTWVESDHPYKPATVSNIRVVFPPTVAWLVLEMDPRSGTGQPEDSLIIYAASDPFECDTSHLMGSVQHHTRLTENSRSLRKNLNLRRGMRTIFVGQQEKYPFTEKHVSYVPISSKMSNVTSDWPQKALVVPGNEVIFSLETATDYLNDFKGNWYGYRCLVVGHEEGTPSGKAPFSGLRRLEMELAYAAGACAARLLAPDVDKLSRKLVDDNAPFVVNEPENMDELERSQPRVLYRNNEAVLLSQGLELAHPPTVHQVLQGQINYCKDTTERRFLRDLVAGADGTAGGRLAAWLLPESRVAPAHCEIRARAPDADVRADCPLPLVVYLRDQYGDLVRSLPVTVDISAQPITSSSAAHRKNRHLSYQPRQNYGGRVPPPTDVHYKPTIKDAMCFHAITMMKPYQSHSFEEIRMACPNSSGIAHRPPEKLLVHLLLDGTYSSTWTPTVPGTYVLQCTIDEQPVSQDLVIEVKESISTSVGLRSPSGPGPSKISGSSRTGSESQTSPSRPCKLRRFSVLQSAGLRIRAHPSLQSEQIGIVQVHTTIAFTDEVQNGDGIWLRLSYDCARTFCNIKSAEAWCLQYHQQLAKTLLVSIEPPSNAKIMDNENPWLYDDRRTIYGLPYPEYSGDSNAPESPEPEPEELPPNAEPQIEDSDSDSKKGFDFTVKDLDQPNPNNDFRFTADDNASPFVFGDDEDDLIRDDMLSMINPSSPKEDIDSENIPKAFKFGNGNGSSPPEFREWRHKYGSSSRDSSLSDSHSSSFERFMKNRITNDFSHASMQQQDPPKLTQTGTQTSPEAEVERSFKGKFSIGSSPKSDPASPRHRNYSSPDRKIPTSKLSVSPNESSNPLPSTSATPISYPPTPKPQKFAVGFAEAESIRAVFAALLWHEGIVHDAMACASFLKFHPSLPKEGTMVVTRNTNQKTAVTQHRHSVEVSNAGTYLNIQASTLESLTRSGLNASRARAKRDATSIREEEAGPSTSSFIPKQTEQKDKTDAEPPNVVCVLPQALRALVALWDAMCVAQGVIIPSADRNCTEKKDKKLQDTMKDKDLKKGTRKKKEWKPNAMSPYTIFCELCAGSTISPPMAGHMRRVHPGCGIPCIRGYDRNGIYGVAQLSMPQVGSSVTNGSTCGHVTQGYNLWYILCEVCRDKSIRTSRQNKSGLSSLKAMPGLYADENNEKMDMQAPLEISRLHMTAKENALFLLELVPALNSSNVPKAAEKTQTYESQASDSPTTTTSTWHPVPPFQCMDTLGVQVKDNDDTYNFGVRDFAHKDYGGTQQSKREPTQRDSDYDESSNEGSSFENPEAGASSAMFNRFHRSVSMGQGSSQPFPQDESTAEIRKNQGEDVSGSSLLGQPSPALENLVFSCDGPTSGVSVLSTPHVDVNSLSNRPVMTFISGNRDLVALRNHMLDSIKMSTVRQYALEAMNWFMHSVTQPICLHDLMWWFCAALEQFNMLGISADNTDRFDNNNSRGNMPRHPYSSSSYGSSGGIRFALHAFLRSVGKLMQVLPNSSPALLQAVRCWALRYSPTDHTFLHRSQVFSVISKILSHSEDDTSEEGAVGFTPSEGISTSMNEKNYENYVWSCPDITSLCEVSVSSRQGMISSLTDGSTETFWESGDEDRNKSKWVQVAFHANSDERPHMICLHIDNTRDPSNKTLMVTFLMGGSSSDLYNIQNIEVDTKTGSWACFTLPRDSNPPVRIRCELRGPDQASRVRQLKVFGAPVPKYVNHNMPNVLPGNFLGAGMQKPVTTILRQYIELETLRVFRLITSQVFGKLLEGEPYNEVMLGTESPGGGKIGQGSDDTNLREHVVGILFSRSKLTSLQKQVMTHIVSAIGSEAKRAREEWENNLNLEEMNSGKATPTDNSTSESDGIKQQDNYCFEMLSMVLALSGSSVGRAHLARRPELLSDLLSLLHTGSARVQRQVIALLRRMVCELSPQKMDAALNIGIQSQTHRTTLIDNLVTYLSKAISVQVKVKGVISNNAAGPSTSSGNRTSSMYGPGRPSGGATIMANNVFLTPPGYWFMKGITTRKHAQLVIDLLSEMADGKVMQAWSTETQNALAKLVARLITVPEPNRSPQQSLANPQLWLALGALCVLEENHIDRLTSCGWMDILNQSEGGKKNSDTKQPRDKESRPFCINHDDSETVAIIECQNCGLLCQECDRFLHLSRNTRHHHRQICKEEESSIRIDVHEGCGRAKLFWLLLLVDRRALKALAEFRGSSDTGQDLNPDAASTSCWTPGSAGTCRFCGARSNTGLLAIGNVCADHDCQEYSRSACPRILQCGHLCGGVRGERSCLPCLNGCSVPGVPRLRQDADDMCMICFTDPLAAAPAIQLKCRHLFHLHCCKKVLANKWNGPRITFSFSQCPICKENMSHNTLEDLVAPIRKLQEEVMRKALMRLEYEGLKNAAVIATRYRNDPASYAMEKYAYYVCFKCHKAYYGGEARCEIELVEGAGAGWGSAYDPSELVCGACSDIAGARTCPKHGADFLEYKCRYCCSVAVFFCFGTSHFCNACHDDFQRVTNVPQHQLPVCPAGPKAKQLEGSSDDCPLHVKHPCTGEEFALGCGVCRNAHTF